jgi:hypothetical protein
MVEGDQPEEILGKDSPVWMVCERASEIGEWGEEPQGPTEFSPHGNRVGQSIQFERMTWGITGIFTDLFGEFFSVVSPEEDPRRLVVISGRRPEIIDLDSLNWRSEIAGAVVRACEQPGVYRDFELVYGRIYRHTTGKELEELLSS